MAKKTKAKKSSLKGFGPAARSGMSLKELKKSVAKKGTGDFDPEKAIIGDGDVVTLTFVGEVPESWCEFDQHYLGKAMGYRICAGDGCSFCDEGNRPSARTMVPVYIHQHYKAERDNNPAKKFKDVGYRYITLSKTVTAGLTKRLERRKTLQDYQYTLAREGNSTDTIYDIEREQKKTDKKIILGWKEMDAFGKIVKDFESENEGVKVKGKKRVQDDDDDEDEDYEYDDEDIDDDDYDDDEDDEDEDEDDEPRRSRSSKSKKSSKKSKKGSGAKKRRR